MNKSAAFTSDAAAFAVWAKLSNPSGMTANEIQTFLTSNGVTVFTDSSSKPSSKRGPLQKGEIVYVDASKCLAPENVQNCKKLTLDPNNEIFCVVSDIICPQDLAEMCTIRLSAINPVTGRVGNKKYDFKAVYPTRIAGLTKKLNKAEAKGDDATKNKVLQELRDKSLAPHNGVGIYRSRYSSLKAYKEALVAEPPSETFVVVYERGGNTPTPEIRKMYAEKKNAELALKSLMEDDFADLVDEDFEKQASTYYEGEIHWGAFNKKGEFYFKMLAHGVDTYVNPSVGRIYYIASVRNLPSISAWTDDLKARLKAQVEANIGEKI
jgi:hypothetical protein